MGEPAGSRRVPGWYLDPSDPTRLRYWGGRAWTNRRRPRPGWEVSSAEWAPPEGPDGAGDEPVLEGPVQPAELPAIASAVSSAREALAPPAPGARRGQTRRPSGLGGRTGEHWTAGHHPAPWPSPRRPVVVFCVLSVLALVAMVTTVGLARPGGQPAAAELTDQTFVNQANALCATRLPGLRITEGTGGAIGPRAQGLARLAGQLGRLPIASGDRPHVQAWLDDWQRYARDQQVSTAGSPGQAARDDADQAQNRADRFAVANGLIQCTLSDHPASGAAPY